MAEMRKKELMAEIIELTHNLSIYQFVHEAPTHTLAYTFVQRCSLTCAYTCKRAHDGCTRPQDGDQDGVDNETASDPVHL